MEEAAKQLALLPFWTALSAAERDMAARAAFLRRYDRGQPIYEGGSGCLGLVCVVSGGVRAYLLSEEGREVTLFRLAPGDVCVLSASCVIQQITFDLHIAAERACELLVLPAEAFERLEGSCEAVRSFVHARTAERFSAAMEAVPARVAPKPGSAAADRQDASRASESYSQLTLAAHKLLDVVERMQNRGKKEQRKLTSGILALVKKFSRR